MAYATVEDLEARYGELFDERQEQASVLLDDAAVLIDCMASIDTGDETRMAAAKAVSCSMVNRALSASESDMYGVSQQTMTAGSYSQSTSYSNPSGDLYLTGTEKAMLGISGGYIGSIRPRIGGSDD